MVGHRCCLLADISPKLILTIFRRIFYNFEIFIVKVKLYLDPRFSNFHGDRDSFYRKVTAKKSLFSSPTLRSPLSAFCSLFFAYIDIFHKVLLACTTF